MNKKVSLEVISKRIPLWVVVVVGALVITSAYVFVHSPGSIFRFAEIDVYSFIFTPAYAAVGSGTVVCEPDTPSITTATATTTITCTLPPPNCGGGCSIKINACGEWCKGTGVGTSACEGIEKVIVDPCPPEIQPPTCGSGCQVKTNCAGSCTGSSYGTETCPDPCVLNPSLPECTICSGTYSPPWDQIPWGTCSAASCEGGTQSRSRSSSVGSCPDQTRTQSCNNQACLFSPTLTATLSAAPVSGSAPLNDVDLSVTNVGGTATGPIEYRFRCNSSGDGWGSFSSTNSYSCDYVSPGNYTALGQVRRENTTTEVNRTISVTNPPPLVELSASGRKANSCYDIDWSVDNVVSCTPDSNPDHATWNGTDFNSQIASGIESGTVEVCDLQTATTLTLTCGGPDATASITIAEPFFREINPGESFNFLNFLRGLFPGFIKSSYALN